MKVKLSRVGLAAIMPLALFFLLVLLTPKPVAAATITWNGGSGNWEDGANWSGGSVPSSGIMSLLVLALFMSLSRAM